MTVMRAAEPSTSAAHGLFRRVTSS